MTKQATAAPQSDRIALRIKKFYGWARGQIESERRSIAQNKAYIANRTYFEQTRIAPLKGSVRLIYELAIQAGVRLDAVTTENYKYIMNL